MRIVDAAAAPGLKALKILLDNSLRLFYGKNLLIASSIARDRFLAQQKNSNIKSPARTLPYSRDGAVKPSNRRILSCQAYQTMTESLRMTIKSLVC
ncbi:hypothetical protein QT972_21455 [Microcoleus sp. herbarium7]|uniref:hypothetical protein n=1 Tax=Microcoleus sp. herbarium7 TaxID=3055435 RepID=UPI002FCF2FCC